MWKQDAADGVTTFRNGEVIAINSAVVDDPALVNTDPYGEGWLIKVAVDAPAELLSPEEYEALATRA